MQTLQHFATRQCLVLATLLTSVHAAEPNSIDLARQSIQRIGGVVRRQGEEFEVEFHLRGKSLTDSDLRYVAALENVASLNLRDTKISSKGLIHLKGLTSLRRLHLERTAVDDAGIQHLALLANLEYLNLYQTQVTDRALVELKQLKKLRSLYVWQTRVTDAGVAVLRKARPDLKVIVGLDLAKLPDKYPEETPDAKPKIKLKWVAVTRREEAPGKSANGVNTQILFENKSKEPVKLFWITYGGELKLYGEIAPGATRQQNSYSRNVWLVTDMNDNPLGYFVVEEDESQAIIPSQS